MAAIKSFSDLEQSKKLAKILPLESADCFWDYDDLQKYHRINWFEDGYNKDSQLRLNENNVCAWSLAALLSVLPYTIKLSCDMQDSDGNPAYKNECYTFSINRCGLFGDKWNTQYYNKHKRQLGNRYKELYIDLFFSQNYDNPIDACVAMIEKLNELKTL